MSGKRTREGRVRSYGRYAAQMLMDGTAVLGNAAMNAGMGVLTAGAASAGAGLAASGVSVVSDMSSAIQEGMRRAGESLADTITGGAAMDIGENAVVPAQFIPGRGAELSYQRMNILAPIKFKTGESVGPKITSAYGREQIMYQHQSAMHAFAYKMQLTPPSFVSTADSVPVNRFVVHNVFRHVLAGPNNTTSNQNAYGKNDTTWNRTLGPDKSYVRRLGGTTGGGAGTGSASSVPPASSGLVTTLQSPFRYPANGEFMYARMTRQMIENLCWNANPMKLHTIGPGAGTPGTAVPLYVYPNAQSYTGLNIVSMPNQVPQSSTEDPVRGQSYYYRTQTGRGQLAYTFNNDGTNPVVVDVVITRLKKNEVMTKKQLVDRMVQSYQLGYLNYSYANRAQADLAGQPPQAVDVTTNARCTFLPAKALNSYKTYGPVPADASATNAFKQVARDQFILAGGSSRNWSMYMTAMDYNASLYSQYNQSTQGNGVSSLTYDDASNCVDDLSYIVSIAISGVPAPYVEFNSGATYPDATTPLASVIDRRGTDCSVSVTGAYKETCHPVYITRGTPEPYINGRLDIAHFDSGTGPTNPSLTTNDIANIGQAVRGPASSSALIGMGPFNSVGGG